MTKFSFRTIGTLGWFLLLGCLAFFADTFIQYDPSFPYYEFILPASNLPRWLYSWGNFDGVHYLTIIDQGYLGAGLIQAFFPLYPLLGLGLSSIIGSPLVSLMLINLLGLVGLYCVWPKFATSFGLTEQEADWAWLSLLFFPTGFFLAAAYTESLFLFLIVGCFWLARTKRWGWAVALASAATATRIIGVFILPALLIEAWIQFKEADSAKKKQLKALLKQVSDRKFKKLSASLIGLVQSIPTFIKQKAGLLALVTCSISGLALYMAFLYWHFQDPLYFYRVQAEFGAGRQESLILFPQVIWRYLKILATYQAFDWRYFAYIQELGLALISLTILIYSFFKLRTSLVFFGLAAWLLPTLTGTFSSMPRYVLVCLPVFLLLGKWANSSSLIRFLYFGLAGLLLMLNTILFIQGYWVA